MVQVERCCDYAASYYNTAADKQRSHRVRGYEYGFGRCNNSSKHQTYNTSLQPENIISINHGYKEKDVLQCVAGKSGTQDGACYIKEGKERTVLQYTDETKDQRNIPEMLIFKNVY